MTADGTNAIDLVVYPIHDRDAPRYRELVTRCRDRFRSQGVVLLPGFLTTAALSAVSREAAALVPRAYFCRSEHNVYLTTPDSKLSEHHPVNRSVGTTVGSIANDYLDPRGVLHRLYDSPALTGFIADVVEADELFVSADTLGAVTVNVFKPGDGHGWHFDESPFSVTLMVQPAEQGGHFEYVQGLRPEAASLGDLGGIDDVLNGESAAAPRLAFEPGTLSIFAGHHTMHRVTEVRGSRPRLVPVLTYSDAPGYRNSDKVRELFWGRTG